MPFAQTSLMNERLCFVAACLRGDEPMALLCALYGINRKTGWKWCSGIFYLSEALAREKVGLVLSDDGNWIIPYRYFNLATLDDRLNEIRSSGLARSGQP